MSQKHQPKSGSHKNQARKPAPPTGSKAKEVAPEPSSLHERVAALEQNQLSFVRVFNANMGAHQSALYATDALIHVLQRVANDLNYSVMPYYKDAKGEPTLREPGVLVYLDREGLIDFPRYIAEYYAVIGFTDFVIAMKQWRQTHQVVADGVNDNGTPKFRVVEMTTREEHEEPSDVVEEVITEFGGDGV